MNIKGKFTYTQEVIIYLVQKGMKIREVALPVHYFKERNSLISGNLGLYGFKSLEIIGKATRDVQPLNFFGMPGIIFFSLGLIGGVYSFAYWIINHATTPIRNLLNLNIFITIAGISIVVLALSAEMKSIRTDQ